MSELATRAIEAAAIVLTSIELDCPYEAYSEEDKAEARRDAARIIVAALEVLREPTEGYANIGDVEFHERLSQLLEELKAAHQ